MYIVLLIFLSIDNQKCQFCTKFWP